MRTALLDKIASVTLNSSLRRDVRLSDEYRCQEGDIIAVRAISAKTTYNSLELTTGRMSTLKPGDVIAGALGHRNALQGYAGRIPEKLATGYKINLLNMGGVLGECTSYSPMVGAPMECEVLGTILDFPFLASRIGVPASIKDKALPMDGTLEVSEIAVIAVAGTSMNSGKTEACLTLVQQLVRSGKKVAAGKATGVSLRRDILAMEDAGAFVSTIFTDFGVVTTQKSNGALVARAILTRLALSQPDVIVLELGDGLMGDYGVDAILNDVALRRVMGAVLLAASDPVGAWGGVELLRKRFKIEPCLVTGPATDNAAGVSILERETGVPGFNARQSPLEFSAAVVRGLEKSVK